MICSLCYCSSCFKYAVVFFIEVLEYYNDDFFNIITPVNAEKLRQLLMESKYPQEKIEYLVDGFLNGFDLKYLGPKKVESKANNLVMRVGNKTKLWNKVMQEVKDGRYAGPFEKIPYKYYIQSPIGLIPKGKGRKNRLIFHLSYPKGTDESVNAGIPLKKIGLEISHPEGRTSDYKESLLLCGKMLAIWEFHLLQNLLGFFRCSFTCGQI